MIRRRGANASAIVYTVVETAKANGLEPYRYLKLLLTELPYLGKTPSQEDLMQFLPWSKTMQAACTELKTNINAPGPVKIYAQNCLQAPAE